MKVKCINNNGQEDALKIGNIYDVVRYEETINDDFYYVIIDNKIPAFDGGYYKYRFIELSIKDERTLKIKKLNESSLY